MVRKRGAVGFNLESQMFAQGVLGAYLERKRSAGFRQNLQAAAVNPVAPFVAAVLRKEHPNGDGTPPNIVMVQYSLAFAKHWSSIVWSIVFFSRRVATVL